MYNSIYMAKFEATCVRVASRVQLFVLSVALTGCAAFNYEHSDAPVAQATPQLINNRIKVAVVLGSGGPRGYAHVGVIKVLEEAGIQPDLIVGTSVGALIGAFWASGLNAKELEDKAFSGGPLTLFDINPFADRGWIRGERLQTYVRQSIKAKSIEQLQKNLIVVATRRDDKSPTFFYKGNLAVAVRASSAVPGVISPVGINGVDYEDGDVSLPLAVSAARAAGANFIIAVDVSAHANSAPANAKTSWLERDAKRRGLIEPEVLLSDFLVHPDMGYKASPQRSYFEKAFTVGEATMRKQLPALKEKLKSRALH